MEPDQLDSVLGGAVHHDFHHKTFEGPYSSVFTVGGIRTDKEFRAYQKKLEAVRNRGRIRLCSEARRTESLNESKPKRIELNQQIELRSKNFNSNNKLLYGV